ncbi:MAG: SH3 domain-containing protein [Bacteroidota bacterium]
MMKTKIYLLASVLAFSNLFCIAQTEMMVVAKSGIAIRESATTKAKSVGSVKFGEMVLLIDHQEPSTPDTVDGMTGEWFKAKYNGVTGYVFDAYLGNFRKQDKKFPKNYPQYFTLSAVCGEDQYFNSDFYWYGVFDMGDKFKVSRVKVEFSVKKENWSDKMYDKYLRIGIDNPNKPIFLVGLPDSLPDYEFEPCEFTRSQSHLKEYSRDYGIYPGQHFYIGNTTAQPKHAYYLEAYGNVSQESGSSATDFVQPVFRIKDYKIRMVQVKDQQLKITKDLTEDLEKPVIYEGLPQIKFIGDLNYDGVPDILLAHSTSHASAGTSLFISGYDINELLTNVAFNKWGACY